MTHEGRMRRGKENVEKGILPNNADTIYFLENSKVEETKPKEDKKETKKGKKEKDDK